MDLDEILTALNKARTALHEQFPGATARLAQLDAHLATAADVVSHLFDEHTRHNHDPLAHAKAIGQYVRRD